MALEKQHFTKTDWRGNVVDVKHSVGRVRPPSRAMRWVSLHGHSTFSYLDGVRMPEDHVRRAAELNMPAIALTEHGSVTSHVKLEQAAEEIGGVKPIYGCEFYMSPGKTQRKNHLTVLAQNDIGYRNLMRLSSLSWENYYYQPKISPDELFSLRSGLVVLSGCLGSELATSILGGKLVPEGKNSYARGRRVASRYRDILAGSYFIEVQAIPELESARSLNPALARLAHELDIPLVATMDLHMISQEDSATQQILHNVRPGNRMSLEEQAANWGYNVQLWHPENDWVVIKRLMGTGLTKKEALEAWANAGDLGQDLNVQLPRLPMVRFPCGPGKTSKDIWREWLRAGWKLRGLDRLRGAERQRYVERLRYESSIIEDKDYVDYFLVVADGVRYAKDHGILVGPARGSAAASLCCYLLRITEVNPMVFPDLVFERFIDLTRKDLPDIDLDFPPDRRGEVRQFYVDKYGADAVGNVGSYVAYKGKNSLDDVARATRVPKWEVEVVKNLLIERSSGDLRASATIEDTIEQFDQAAAVVERHPSLLRAVGLEGNMRGQGVHAAGIVVANGPITDVCAVLKRKVKGTVTEVIAYDKYDAERQGMLKIDVLSLGTCSMLNDALDWLGLPVDHLYKVNLEDPKVLQLFKENDTVGVFQFDGQSMRNLNGSLRAETFKEVCDATALVRPGPLHSGSSANYVDAKWGRRELQSLHPLFDEIAKTTYFQIIYQEQILRIMGEIGGFDHVHRTHIRKIISKKLGVQEFNRQWEQFRDGAARHDVKEPQAREIFNLCITAGAYAFNAAHCVSYGMLAYWCAWLKAYHPQVFYPFTLKWLNKDKHLQLMRDAVAHDVKILPPHPRRSGVTWLPHRTKRAAQSGLSQIPDIGEKTAVSMVKFRKKSPVTSWRQFIQVKGIGEKTVEKMQVFANAEDPFGIRALERHIASVRKDLRHLIDPSTGFHLPQPTFKSEDVPYERGKDTEIVWLGVINKRNLRDIFEAHHARTGEDLDPSIVRDAHLREQVGMVGVDETDLVHITVDRWKYPRFRDDIWNIRLEHDLVLVKGIKKGFQARRCIYVTKMWVIDPDPDIEEEEAA